MATVPTPLDWIAKDGQFVSAIELEEGVGDALSFLLDPPGAQVRRTTSQSIPNNTPTAVLFDAEDFDNDTMHSTVTNTSRLTCFTAGRYLVSGVVSYDVAATGAREARIYKNGGPVNGGRVLLEGPMRTVVAPTIEVALIVGDYLELLANQTSGGALLLSATTGVFPMLRARWCGL